MKNTSSHSPRHALHIGLVSKTFYYAPVWAALEQGYFDEEELEIS